MNSSLNHRFRLAIADYQAGAPDMPAGLPVCIYDRKAKRIVLRISPEYANLICLETLPDGAPFTSMVNWMNATSDDALLSEDIPSEPQTSAILYEDGLDGCMPAGWYVDMVSARYPDQGGRSFGPFASEAEARAYLLTPCEP